MTTAPSARPPSSLRRKPDLDSDHARQFVERAASHPSTEPATGEGRGEVKPENLPLSTKGNRREQLRPLTLRIPEELHSALLYIAENSSKSMNQFAIDVLTPAAATQISKIVKRKELGLE